MLRSALHAAFVLLTSACLLSSVGCALLRQSLDGSDWTLSNANGSIRVPASVPGVVHLDLLAAGLIAAPYYRFNEREQAWIWQEPYWNYTRTLSVSAAELGCASVELVFDGLDTIAEVRLNGRLVLSSSNQFRRYTVGARPFLVPGSNSLSLSFQSPMLWARAYHDRYPYELPGPRPQQDDPAEAIPYRNYIRKVQSDFDWDWGPGFAPSGIWKHAELRAFDSAVLVDCLWQTRRSSDSAWAVNVTAYLRVSHAAPTQSGRLVASVAGVERSLDVTLPASSPFNGDELSVVWLSFEVDSPELWWPVGYGSPRLYELSLSWQGGGGETDSLTRRVGFRSIRVVRERIPPEQPGLSMFFEVNGLPVFIKGSNLVPFSSFHSNVSAADVSRVLQSALLSHQNLIRVWGGGLYQQDALYDFADEHGILVWQEFAFACAFYSVDKWFLDSVREEVSQVVRRLSSHASLAIYGGNNENEAALMWQQETITYRDRYLTDYNQLYVNTVRDALRREIADSIEFQVSSPTNGPLSLQPFTQIWGYASNDTMGDNHWYKYDCDCSNVTEFPRSRFISEFGFQSFPSFITWREISLPEDWSFRSALSQYRQHHDDGLQQMESQVRKYFLYPSASDSVQLFDDELYMTQVAQAFCYGMEIHHWRRIRNETEAGLGRTMGAVYWQLNDVWQAPTWSSIEYGGRWKQLLYAVKAAFAPLLVSGYVDPIGSAQAKLFLYAVSDLTHEQRGTLTAQLRLWTTGAVLATQAVSFTLPALTAARVYSGTVASLTQRASGLCDTVTDCFLQLLWSDEQQRPLSEHVLLLGKLAASPLADPNITLAVLPADKTPAEDERRGRHQPPPSARVRSVQVNVSSAAPAAWVFVETETAGHFDSNAFVLLPDAPRLLTFTGYDEFSTAEFSATLQVRSVWDVTHRG